MNCHIFADVPKTTVNSKVREFTSILYLNALPLTFLLSAFAFGSVTLDGLHIASYFESPNQKSCKSDIFILVYVMHLLFTFVQTFFLFKNHKVLNVYELAVIKKSFEKYLKLLKQNTLVWYWREAMFCRYCNFAFLHQVCLCD